MSIRPATRLLASAVLAVGLTACSNGATAPDAQVAFDTVKAQQTLTDQPSAELVITDAATFATEWTTCLGSPFALVPAPPEIDFTTRELILIRDRYGFEGGSVVVEDITRADGTIAVSYSVSANPCVDGPVMGTPFTMVTIAKTAEPVTFDRHALPIPDCS
ncbi:MAG: hypothetical protein ABI743_10715 [bacterium]